MSRRYIRPLEDFLIQAGSARNAYRTAFLLKLFLRQSWRNATSHQSCRTAQTDTVPKTSILDS